MSALELPVRLEAHEPPEVHGEGRDDVALLVATRHDLELVHARFRDLPRFLSAGDLLVVNASATLPAALDDPTRRATSCSSGSRRRPPTAPGSSSCGPVTGAPTRDRLWASASSCRAAPTPSSSRVSPAAIDSPSRVSSSPSRWRTTSAGTGNRSGTGTSPSRGRSRPTRPSSPASTGAPRCRVPAGRSRRSS